MTYWLTQNYSQPTDIAFGPLAVASETHTETHNLTLNRAVALNPPALQKPGSSITLDPTYLRDHTNLPLDAMELFVAYPPTVYTRGQQSDLRMLRDRQLKMTPPPNSNTVRDFSAWIDAQIIPYLGRVRHWMSFEEWVSRYPEGKRKILRLAHERVSSCEWTEERMKSWSNYKAFQKEEKLYGRTSFLELEDKPPRCIISCSDEILAILGPPMASISKYLSTIGFSQRRFGDAAQYDINYTSSLNSLEIGNLVNNWVPAASEYLETDKSSFDASITGELLKVEFGIYRALGLSPILLRFLEISQIDTQGMSQYGVGFKVPGTRKSGTPNTSCGNTLLATLSDVYALYRFNPNTTWHVISTGDDLLAVSSHALTEV
jgi:hypothetical protein